MIKQRIIANPKGHFLRRNSKRVSFFVSVAGKEVP